MPTTRFLVAAAVGAADVPEAVAPLFDVFALLGLG
jgi:hypothetical protein